MRCPAKVTTRAKKRRFRVEVDALAAFFAIFINFVTFVTFVTDAPPQRTVIRPAATWLSQSSKMS